MRKILTQIALVLYFFSGTIYVVKHYNQYQLPMLLASVLLILVTHLYAIKIIRIHSNIEEISYLLFSFSIMISGFVNREISSVISGIGMLALWFAFSLWLSADILYERVYLNKIHYLILVPYVLLVLYSYVTSSISLYRYAGIFRTANGMGDAAATAFAVIAAKVIYDYEVDKVKILDIIILLFTVFNCLISTCRGATISIVIMAVLGVLIGEGNTSKNYKKIKNYLIGIVLMVLIVYFLYRSTAFGDAIQNIIEKFQVKSNNVLDGRTERWDIIFARAKIFGNGEDIDVAAHNSFLSILDQYGFFSFLFLIIFSASALIRSVTMVRNTRIRGIGKYIAFFSCVGFVSMSMTEGMMLKTIMLMVVFCFPLYRGQFILCETEEQDNESNVSRD